MQEIEKQIGNVKSMKPVRKRVGMLSPSENEGIQRQYQLVRNTSDYNQRVMKYASDLYMARVQGIDEDDFYKWFRTRIRMSAMVRHGTTTNIIEDWKKIKFESSKINAVGLGAKIECNGDTYIVSNPDEAQGAQGTSVCRRCNVTWRRYDFYGNIKEEPFYWAKNQSQASANEYMDYIVSPNLYQKCVMQLNEDTRDLITNRRMILGSMAYMVRGLIDFLQSETGNIDSTHILYFDLQSQEPIESDDLEKRIADGKGFDMHASLTGVPAKTIPGKIIQTGIETVRNGQILSVIDGVTYGTAADGSVERLGEYPLTWRYESTDKSVATVDDDGLLTTVGEGECVIRATLDENENIFCEAAITVSAETEEGIEWLQSPERCAQYQSVTLEAGWFSAGENTGDPIEYIVRTEDTNAASYELNGNVMTLTGFLPGKVTVTAMSHGEEKTVTVTVYGF